VYPAAAWVWGVRRLIEFRSPGGSSPRQNVTLE